MSTPRRGTHLSSGMSVSRGHALLWSAALHTLGLGVAGWTTYGQYRQPSRSELHVTRAYALHFPTLAPTKTRTEPRPVAAATSTRPAPRVPRLPSRVPLSAAPAPTYPMLGARADDRDPKPSGPSAQARELPAGATVTALAMAGPPPEAPASQPVARGVDRAASLVVPTGSACPQLPPPPSGARGHLAVAVAVVVEADGRVDPGNLRVVESPSHPSSERRFYPRIYVVGARAGRGAHPIDPAAYDSVITSTVTRHMTGLAFHPALKEGHPVRSTVLIACHQGES